MAKLKAKGLKWLKGFHLIAVCCWVGGGVSLLMLYFLKDEFVFWSSTSSGTYDHCIHLYF